MSSSTMYSWQNNQTNLKIACAPQIWEEKLVSKDVEIPVYIIQIPLVYITRPSVSLGIDYIIQGCKISDQHFHDKSSR